MSLGQISRSDIPLLRTIGSVKPKRRPNIFAELTSPKVETTSNRKNTFVRTMFDSLSNGLYVRGFKRWGKRDIEDIVKKSRFWSGREKLNFLDSGEYLFNVGVDRESGEGKPRSNFFVFVKKIEDRIVISFYNPRSDKNGLTLPKNEVFKRFEYSSGNVDDIVDRLLSEIETAMEFKNEFEYRAQLHGHIGGSGARDDYLSNIAEEIKDDGESHPIDFLKTAAYFQTDILAWTAHNWINMQSKLPMYEIMLAIANGIGILFPPSTEITMPLKKNNPNGPHHIVMLGDMDAAEEIQENILSRRNEKVRLICCYEGLTLDGMYKILRPLRESGRAIVGIAHPFNYNHPDLELKSVGLFSAVDLKHLRFRTAINFATEADFIASFNPTLYEGEAEVKNKKMKKWIIENMNKLGLDKINASSASLAIALAISKLREKIGKFGNTSFDPDDHRVLPVTMWGNHNYEMGGNKWGMGHTKVILPPAFIAKLKRENRKMTEREFVKGVSEGSIKLESIIFWENRDGMSQIVRERSELSPPNKRLDGQMHELQNWRYVKKFLETAGEMSIIGKGKDVGRILK